MSVLYMSVLYMSVLYMSVLLVLPRIEKRQIKTTQPDQLYRAAAHYWRTVHHLTDKQVRIALEHFKAGATLAEAAQAGREAAQAGKDAREGA